MNMAETNHVIARPVEVAAASGKIQAEQLHRISRVIGGVTFSLLVTRVPGDNLAAVTDPRSGKSLVRIGFTALSSCRGDYRRAAHVEIDRLIQCHGEERIKAVLLQG
ncbi:MAG: hypothetical protein VB141_11245 [Burkholderia gladioli]